MERWFALAAALIVLAGAPFYLYDILRGVTKPQRTTWLIWSIQGIIAFTAQALLGGGWSLLYIGLEAGGNVVVFLLALRFGVGGWQRIDKIALVVALAGVALSLSVRQPVIALLGVVAADAAGVVLTLLKTFRAPASETAITWAALGTASLLTAFSVGQWSLPLLLYPLYLALSCYAVLGAKLAGRLVAAQRRSI